MLQVHINAINPMTMLSSYCLVVLFSCVVSNPIVTVPLDKQYVPVIRQNRTVMYKTAYFGTLFVGLPQMQNFTVVFDTGSGHLLLPSNQCDSETCLQHRRFNREASLTAVEIDHDGNRVSPNAKDRDQVEIAFGTGEVVGDFVYETVCLADRSGDMLAHDTNDVCVKVRVILATEMTKEPFHAFEFDGVLGLGLESLAVDPEFSFLGQIGRLKGGVLQQFGVFVSKSDEVASEISFGGHDQRRIGAPLKWAPVNKPELGYWQVRLTSVYVGDVALDICEDGECIGILDTGTSLLGVPRPALQDLNWKLARKVEDLSEDVDCRDFPGPELVFNLDGLSITLGAEDYSRPAATRVLNSTNDETIVICRATLLPVDMAPPMSSKTFILGEPALRKYYTAYDWGEKRVGFAPALQPDPAMVDAPKHNVIGAPISLPTPAVVQI